MGAWLLIGESGCGLQLRRSMSLLENGALWPRKRSYLRVRGCVCPHLSALGKINALRLDALYHIVTLTGLQHYILTIRRGDRSRTTVEVRFSFLGLHTRGSLHFTQKPIQSRPKVRPDEQTHGLGTQKMLRCTKQGYRLRRLWDEEPHHPDIILAKTCYLYRGTRRRYFLRARLLRCGSVNTPGGISCNLNLPIQTCCRLPTN